MIFLGIILLILLTLDVLTTTIGLKLGSEEGNPLFKKSFENGMPLTYIIIKIGLGCLFIFLLSFGVIIIFWIAVGLDLFVFIIIVSNIINILIQKKWNKIDIKNGKKNSNIKN